MFGLRSRLAAWTKATIDGAHDREGLEALAARLSDTMAQGSTTPPPGHCRSEYHVGVVRVVTSSGPDGGSLSLWFPTPSGVDEEYGFAMDPEDVEPLLRSIAAGFEALVPDRTGPMEDLLRDLLTIPMFGADDDDEFVAEYRRISHERDQRALNALAERAERLLRGSDDR